MKINTSTGAGLMALREENCWAVDEGLGPCSGGMSCSEDYPGMYMYFCEGHGHPEDRGENQS